MSDDEETQNEFVGGVRGCVILIDVSPSMWIDLEEKKPIDVALESCLDLFRKMIIESPKQLVGVSLYGTDQNDNQGIENVMQIIPLSEPTVEAVTKLKHLLSDPDDIRKWGSTDDFNLADALWQGSKTFSGCKKVMNSQSVILMSSLGEPDLNKRRAILQKAKDLKGLNINIEFINLSNKTVSPDSFYVEIGKVIVDNPNIDWELPEPVSYAADVVSLLWSNHHRAFAFAVLKFMLSPDIYLGVKLYYLQRKKEKPKKVRLNRDTNEVIKSYTITYASRDTEADGNQEDLLESSESTSNFTSNTTPLSRSDITHTATFGERTICLTEAEMYTLKTLSGEPCIKLLGFKPESVVNMPELFLKNSAFLYPNESGVEGSTKLFLALRDQCLALGRIPICLLVSRWKSHASPVALIPQKRVMNGGRQVYPDGFHVVYLPYADDLKKVPLTIPLDLSIDQKQCMDGIINKLKINYDDSSFENPTLQTFYKALEALALEEDLQIIEDTTRPEVDEQDERLEDLVERFNNVFGSMVPASVKRSQNSDKPNKKQATANENIDKDVVKNHLENDTLHKCTVAELKQILKLDTASTLPALSGLKKDQLLQMVNQNKNSILSSINNAN